MNVLVTGGAGFIGTHTVRALVAQGHEVRILDCLDPQIHGPDADFSDELRSIAHCVRGDVRIEADCTQALHDIDAVYHFASRTGVGQSMYDISDYVATNVHGTAVLIEAIVKSRRPVRRFVLSSSRAVYGEGMFQCTRHGAVHPGVREPGALQAGDFEVHCPSCGEVMVAMPTPTDCPPSPMSIYAITKCQQEEYCQFAARVFSLPLIVLRYFNVYGSLQSLRNPYTGVISVFYSLLRDGQPLSLYERGLPIRDFVHVSDVVRANLLALSPDLAPGAVFNVGTGEAHTIAGIARALASAMGATLRIEDRGEYRLGDIFGCYAALEDSRATLGYQHQCNLEVGLREFVGWAAGQHVDNRYEQTVTELQAHGLFGRAQR